VLDPDLGRSADSNWNAGRSRLERFASHPRILFDTLGNSAGMEAH
jgi:hypothetical protein